MATTVTERTPAPVGDDHIDALPPPATGLSGLRLADLALGVRRYEPVFIVLVVLLAAALVLPGPAIRAANRFFTAPPLPINAPSQDAAGAAEDADGAFPAAPADTTFTASASTFEPAGLAATPPPAAPATPPPTAAPSPPPPSRAGSPAPPATVVEQAPTHTIAAWGWATAQATTPIGGAGVPENSLPVGRRLGEDDKLSFVRLGANSVRLVLRPVAGAGANRFADQAKVQACQILSPGWEAKAGMSRSEAPPYDRNACVAGSVRDDGAWVFELARFDDRTDQRGFALVPAADAPSDFQVAFSTEAG